VGLGGLRAAEVHVDRAADPAQSHCGLGRGGEVCALGDPSERVEVRVAERLDVDRSLDVVEPHERTPTGVTASVKNGCETQASPQSSRR
jgi:hypothetical protein